MKTFQQIATELGVPYCNGIDRGFRCHHRHDLNGSLVNGTIHLRDRQSNRANTLVMLKMVAHARDPSLDADPPWRRVYHTAVAVRGLAAEIHIRLPRDAFDFDRAFVLAGVAGLPNSVAFRKQAYDWARR